MEDSTEVHIHDSSALPIGWSADGAWIYVWDYVSLGIAKIPATGGEAETFFEWPFEGKSGRCTPAADDKLWVCEVAESSTDIWLVENFDPEAN